MCRGGHLLLGFLKHTSLEMNWHEALVMDCCSEARFQHAAVPLVGFQRKGPPFPGGKGQREAGIYLPFAANILKACCWMRHFVTASALAGTLPCSKMCALTVD